ncbi:hypothetical protein FNV43_RR12791 [Rhamnella rubrinervis]|uniref:Uncharacterized protein n=1 Tax=Rhamnella rubrinervis TaxID=2594499 RepID=A0A8K0MIM3_9ROSA|nr:hypothetical protein FNV43_RR12791 [Rhamnella rubrinervis]
MSEGRDAKEEEERERHRALVRFTGHRFSMIGRTNKKNLKLILLQRQSNIMTYANLNTVLEIRHLLFKYLFKIFFELISLTNARVKGPECQNFPSCFGVYEIQLKS